MGEDEPGKHRSATWVAVAKAVGAGVAVVAGSSFAISVAGETVVVSHGLNPTPSASVLPDLPVASGTAQTPRVAVPRSHRPSRSKQAPSDSGAVSPSTSAATDQSPSPTMPATTHILQAQGLSGDVGRHLYTVLLHGTGFEPSTLYYVDVDGQYCGSVVTDAHGEFFQNVQLPPLGAETVPVIELVNTRTEEPIYIPINLAGLIQQLVQSVAGLLGNVIGAVAPCHSLF